MIFGVTFAVIATVFYSGNLVSIGFGDKKVSQYDFEKRYTFIDQTYAKLKIDINSNQELKEELQLKLAQKMISEEVHKNIAKNLNVKVSNSEVKEYMKKHDFQSSEDNIITQNNMVESFLLENKITHNLLSKIDYSEEEIKSYYEENKAIYVKPQNVEFEQVVFKNKAASDSAMKSFTKKSPISYFKESETVILFEGEMDLREESALSEQISQLTPNEWSGLIQVGEEYHLYKVLKKHEERIFSYEEIKDQVMQDYIEDKAKFRLQEMVEDIFEENPPYINI